MSDLEDHQPFSRERLAGYSPDLLERRLLLLGAGALGSALSTQLTMWGFRHVTIVDYDTYEPSNATRTLDFPYRRVAAGRPVPKARELVRQWRARLKRGGTPPGDIRAIVGFAQEVPPAVWRQADLVIGAVDHVRARFEVAQLARRYGKPLVTGGFDGSARGITVRYFPASPEAACDACTRAEEPSYAVLDTSCTAAARRELEAQRVPATPTLAALCGSLMVQEIVDRLQLGFDERATKIQLSWSLAPRGDLGVRTSVRRDPTCPYHLAEPTACTLAGTRLGQILNGIEQQFPTAELSLLAPLPIYAPIGDHLHRIATPAWRYATAKSRRFPRAPRGAYPLAVPDLSLALAAKHRLLALPAAVLGLGPSAVMVLSRDSHRFLIEWR